MKIVKSEVSFIEVGTEEVMGVAVVSPVRARAIIKAYKVAGIFVEMKVAA